MAGICGLGLSESIYLWEWKPASDSWESKNVDIGRVATSSMAYEGLNASTKYGLSNSNTAWSPINTWKITAAQNAQTFDNTTFTTPASIQNIILTITSLSNEIAQVTLPSGSSYYFKDARARDMIAAIEGGGLSFIIAWDGASTPMISKIPAGVSVLYNGTSYTGTLVANQDTKPFIQLVATAQGSTSYAEYVVVVSSPNPVTYIWEKLGSTDLSGLGALAYADTAVGTVSYDGYAANGSGIKVAVPTSFTFTGTTSTASGSATYDKATSVTMASSGSGTCYQPAGTIGVTFIGASMTSTGSYQPAGSNAKSAIHIDHTTEVVKGGASANYICEVSTGTLKDFSATVSGETLILGWAVGTNTYVSSASSGQFKECTTVTGYTAGVANSYAEAQIFTGTNANISVTGTTIGSATGSFTGTKVYPTLGYTSSTGAVSVSGKASGNVTVAGNTERSAILQTVQCTTTVTVSPNT